MSRSPQFVQVPGRVATQVALDPVFNALTSGYFIALAEVHSGRFDPWIAQAAAQLSPAQRHRHRVLFDVLYSAFEPDELWPDVPSYLEHLGACDPAALRRRFVGHMFPP